MAEILEVSVNELLGIEIKNEKTASDLAMRLSQINAQLAIKNRRSRRIWKIITTMLAVFVLLTVLLAIANYYPN